MHLLSLHFISAGVVTAEFSIEGQPMPVATTFTVDDGEIPIASPNSDVFQRFHGSAEELRGIVAAVIAFSRAAR